MSEKIRKMRKKRIKKLQLEKRDNEWRCILYIMNIIITKLKFKDSYTMIIHTFKAEHLISKPDRDEFY